MNPNVGRIINGNAVLDRPTFERVVLPAMHASIDSDAPTAYEGNVSIGMVMTDNASFKNLYTSGRANFVPVGFETRKFLTYIPGDGQEGSKDTYLYDTKAAHAGLDAWWSNPNSLFILDSEEPGNNFHNRRRTLYYRKNDVVLPLSTKTYYQSGDWVDVRAGLVFVFGVVFSLVGAPILSAELSSIAAGEGVVAVAATAPTAAVATTTLASNAGMIVGDNRIGAVATIANVASGALNSGSVPVTQGASMDFNFDASTAFDGFDYSSGESSFAFTDAQNVDFGFGSPDSSLWDQWDDYADIPDGFGVDTYDTSFESGYDFNATPEVTTNAFGTQFEGVTTSDAIKTASTGMQLANAGATLVKGTTGQPSGGGAKASSGLTNSSNDILASIGSFFRQTDGAAKAIMGTAGQRTTAVPTKYVGQLTTQTAATGGADRTMLYVGAAALLGLAFLMNRA